MIVNPDVEVGVPRDRGDIAVFGGNDNIIHPHAHAPIRRLQQSVKQQRSRGIILPDDA